LRRAGRIQRRAARAGFDWRRAEDVAAKVAEELVEVRRELRTGRRLHAAAELGDLLFAVVNLARFVRVNPESALDEATDKFQRRFRSVRGMARAMGRRVDGCSAALLDRFWRRVKAAERGPVRGRRR
jgi:uncharacterized protein YabN with tetrapyrrole methylase and pyrophosphatase domain